MVAILVWYLLPDNAPSGGDWRHQTYDCLLNTPPGGRFVIISRRHLDDLTLWPTWVHKLQAEVWKVDRIVKHFDENIFGIHHWLATDSCWVKLTHGKPWAFGILLDKLFEFYVMSIYDDIVVSPPAFLWNPYLNWPMWPFTLITWPRKNAVHKTPMCMTAWRKVGSKRCSQN